MHKDHCGKVKPVLWLNVTWKDEVLELVDLYPIIANQINSSETVESGFERDLVDMLSMKLNFSV